MTSIVGYTEFLQDGTLVEPAEEQRPMLESIARNGQRLIALCDDPLTLSGLDSGRPVGTEARSTSFHPARRRGRRARSWAAATRRWTWSSRPTRCGWRGRAAAGAGAHEPAEQRDQVHRRRRRDHGDRRVGRRRGLPRSATPVSVSRSRSRDRLFQRFFRSSTAQQRAIQGTGLGLSIVDAIVSAHGGRIDVRSAHPRARRSRSGYAGARLTALMTA